MLRSVRTTQGLLATFISAWFAAITCLIGCTQMGLLSAEPDLRDSVNVHRALPAQADDLMADLPDCHHAGNSSAPPRDNHSPSHSSLSCCPLETTVIVKTVVLPATSAVARDRFTAPDQGLHTAAFRIAHRVPLFWQTGRDTLLNSRLLRV